jgi:hypothetical protein
MICTDYELHSCRDKVFDRLCEIWVETEAESDRLWEASQKRPDDATEWQKDIWRKANTLQAVALYWHSNNSQIQRDKAMGLMKKGYEFYHQKQNDKGIWVDDFGWWCGFFTDLYDYTVNHELPKPFDHATLLAETEHCHSKLQGNLDKIHGGIWNDPDENGQSREKNTITNSWMLNVAANLFMLGDGSNPDYKRNAEAQYTWLTTGRYGSYKPDNWRLYTPEGVLLWLAEGPFTIGKAHDPQFRDVCWTGDEGVFLRGLTPTSMVSPTKISRKGF